MSVGVVNKQTGDRIPTAGMPAIDDALDLTSVNPVQNAIITAALANKQDKTDNALQTTYKTVVGAINEHEGDIGSLKSGLTNVDVALSVPDGTGKNLLPMTVDGIKAANTGITWSGNSTTINNVTFTILTDNDNNVIGIKVDGTSNANALFTVQNFSTNGSYIFNGCPANGSENTYRADVRTVSSGSVIAADIGEGTGSSIVISEPIKYVIRINNGCSINNIIFYPMIRPATITDPTFAPYIPSVESRIEAVESGLANCVKTVKLNIGSSGATQSIPLDKSKIYDIEVSVANNASVYNYYHWFAMYGQSSWITAEISKVEQSTTNVALTYTIDSSNNLVVTNSGNWGATGVIKIATVDK